MRRLLMRTVAVSVLALAPTLAGAQAPGPGGGGPGGPGGAPRVGPGEGGPHGGQGGEHVRGPEGGGPPGAERRGGAEPMRGPRDADRIEERRGPGRDRRDVGNRDDRGPPGGPNPGRVGGRHERVVVTTVQRSRIQTVIRGAPVERLHNVDFGVRVGGVVPVRYRFFPLPPEIIDVVPEYAGYDYIIVDDDILILDPDTREIVYVIPG